VDDLDAMLPELVDVLLWLVAGGLDDFDAAVDDRLAIFRVGRRLDGRQDRQIHRERLLRDGARPCDFLGQIVWGWLRQRGNDAEAAGLGYRGGELCPADPLHAALDDRVLDTDQLSKSCRQHCYSPAVEPGVP